MSHTLSCNFTLETKRGPTYWWPLLFEAMHMHDFSFSCPDYSKGVSHYYYQRVGNPRDSDIVTGSFKQYWEEVYWSWVGVDFPIWATFGKELVDAQSARLGDKKNPVRKLIRRDLRETEHSPGYPYDAVYLLDPVPVPRSLEEGGSDWEYVSLEKYYQMG